MFPFWRIVSIGKLSLNSIYYYSNALQRNPYLLRCGKQKPAAVWDTKSFFSAPAFGGGTEAKHFCEKCGTKDPELFVCHCPFSTVKHNGKGMMYFWCA